ncbi:prephenate/arogenate dehydrogenase family protein [Novosphingobium aerophilum]|uniref:prephenate/arogenate dehydrogenase family protein n=1 Tax=Novosphingobium TaxID=165696 RepID=UPI00104B4103|nr:MULTISPECIES: prephenate/arogenate dehydrogenase family protein [unclassified Novosphingobium]MPS67871.1 prephenate/arogenate dehydrogenase family protein [Novosphingobium sp.]TCM39341.1 cyclohexadieny/prephenate dehydrogenase [Novosphingobium sp. ST904]WRT92889.1 prephenate/arogenate dehydrogenase family protein [Novosphingobium sp. RL4]
MSINSVAIIGLGLQGGSIGLAVQEYLPGVATTGYDLSPAHRARAAERGLVGTVCETPAEAVANADLVIFCVPPGVMGMAAEQVREALPAHCLVSDVGSSKEAISRALGDALPDHLVIPAHPVAGTENSGPDAGFAHLFRNRWCIVTPPARTDMVKLSELVGFWEGLGANVEIMTPGHHDLVLAVTSHLPHLIAYTIVGTASDLEDVTQGEVIKYSAGGFRDFTRIAASDPTMWRDVFLSNKDAVLTMLQRFTEDLTALQRSIRVGDGDALFEHFARTRAIRRSIIEEGQDDSRPDFGRGDHENGQKNR